MLRADRASVVRGTEVMGRELSKSALCGKVGGAGEGSFLGLLEGLSSVLSRAQRRESLGSISVL